MYQFTNSRGENYYLHSKNIKLKGSGKQQTIYFFARDVRKNMEMDDIPQGFKVQEVKRTGMPILKKA